MKDFYIDYIHGKPHQVYYLSTPKLLTFDYRKIDENEANAHAVMKTAKFTQDAADEIMKRRAIRDQGQPHINCRSQLSVFLIAMCLGVWL